MSLLKNLLYGPASRVAALLPASAREPMGRLGIVPWTLLRHGGRAGLRARLREEGIEYGAESDACASFPQGRLRELVGRYPAMLEFRRNLPYGWQPGREWAPVLEESWRPVLDALRTGDDDFLDGFFGGFFRSDAIAGLWGGSGMHQAFAKADPWNRACRASLFLRHFLWWKHSTDGNLDRIEAAPVGRPWGWSVQGRLVVEPTLEYDVEAQDILRLVEDIPHPVVLEIGGGYGGVARQILLRRPDAIYLGFDLAENAILQTCYLEPALPGTRVALHDGDGFPELVPGSATLFPAWKLRDVPHGIVDVAANFRSFGEIHREGLEAIFAELARFEPRWILQENLARTRRDGATGIVMGDYPTLPRHRVLHQGPSAWARFGMDSEYSCDRRLERLAGS